MYNFKVGDIVTIKKDFEGTYSIPIFVIKSLVGKPCRIIEVSPFDNYCYFDIEDGEDGWAWAYSLLELYTSPIGKQYR